MKVTFSMVRDGELVGWEQFEYDPITKKNYAERVKDMPSLAPEWKTLDDAPKEVLKLFDHDPMLDQDADTSSDMEHLIWKEMKDQFSEEEQNALNARAIQFRKGTDAESAAETLIRNAWEQTRIPLHALGRRYVQGIEKLIGYKFHDEYLCAQAFTRLVFDHDAYDPWGCNGVTTNNTPLKFLGDSVLPAVVSKAMQRQYMRMMYDSGNGAPGTSLFCPETRSKLDDILHLYINSSYLTLRARNLHFPTILREPEDIHTDPSTGPFDDLMTALIGAVAVDCGWDMDILEKVVNQLLGISLPSTTHGTFQDPYPVIQRWCIVHFHQLPKITGEQTDKEFKPGVPICHSEVSVPNPGFTEENLNEHWQEIRDKMAYHIMADAPESLREYTLIRDGRLVCGSYAETTATARLLALDLMYNLLKSASLIIPDPRYPRDEESYDEIPGTEASEAEEPKAEEPEIRESEAEEPGVEESEAEVPEDEGLRDEEYEDEASGDEEYEDEGPRDEGLFGDIVSGHKKPWLFPIPAKKDAPGILERMHEDGYLDKPDYLYLDANYVRGGEAYVYMGYNWCCVCTIGSVSIEGYGATREDSQEAAAYEVLRRILYYL